MYRQRNSRALKKARQRAFNLASLDPHLDLGHGLSLAAYLEAIDTTEQKFEAYNAALLQLTRLYDEASEADVNLTDLNGRMFSGIAMKFGRNSTEYKMAGGKTKSRRKNSSTPEEMINDTSQTIASTEAPIAPANINAIDRNGNRNGAGVA